MMKQNLLLEKIKSIDKGGFAEVFLTRDKNTNEYYALKKINEKNLSSKEKGYLYNEIKILNMIKHPNIVRLYSTFKKNDFNYLVLEYCNGGSLYKNLEEYKNKYMTPFPEKLVRHFMKKILLGIKYLHENKIIHRDLKLENILLKYNNEIEKHNNNLYAAEIKIIDFNISYIYKDNLNNGRPLTAVGTVPNMPPSIVNNIIGQPKKYDEKVDIWSLGTLCYEMLFGVPLFQNITDEQIFQNILLGNFTIPHSISKQARSFLYSMLQKDGKYRLNASQLLNHEFIKGNNNNIILNKKNIIKNPNNFVIHNNNPNKIIKNGPKIPHNDIKIKHIHQNIDFNNKNEKLNNDKINLNFNKMCNGCGLNNISVKLYKCKTCFEVNYCEKCYNKLKDTHNHPFIVFQKKIESPKDPFFNKFQKNPVIKKKINQNMELNKVIPLDFFPHKNKNNINFDTI